MKPEELKGAELVNVDLSDATVRDSNLAHITLLNVNMARARIKEAYLVGARIEGDLTGATINGIDFGTMYENELLRLYPDRSRLYAGTPAEFREALDYIHELREKTLAKVRPLPEEVRQRRTSDGEWSIVENLRHLLFAESAWALRTAFNEPEPFHPLGMPPDFAQESAAAVGIRFHTPASYDEVVAALEEQAPRVQTRFDALTPDELREWCTDRGPGYPEDYVGKVSGALYSYLFHEWDHHRIIDSVIEDVT